MNAGYQLWGLVTLFLWMNRWGINGFARPLMVQESVNAVIGAD